MRLTIFRKGLILVGVPFLFQLLLIFLFVELHDRNAKTQNWLAHAKEVLTLTQSLLQDMIDAETGVRGYILTGDEGFTAPYVRALEQLPTKFEALRKSTLAIPDQEARLQRLDEHKEQILKLHADKIRLMRDDAREIAIEKMIGGKKLMDDFRALVDDFLASERQREADFQRSSERARRDSYYLALLGMAAALSSSVIIGVVFSRGISVRLETLAQNARRLSEGKELLPPRRGSDEITEVDRSFRDMHQKLAAAQAELGEQRRLVRVILDSMGDGVVACDGDGKFLIWNPAAKRILGIGATDSRPEEWSRLYGVFALDETTPLAPEDVPLVRALRGESVNQAEVFIRNEKLPQGVIITMTARPLEDDQGRFRGAVAVFHDTTEKRRAADTSRRMNEELESRVRERTLELVEVNRDLSHKNQENEMFVYSVSHDLRSPLVNLQGFSKELEKGCTALGALFDNPVIPEEIKAQARTLLDGKMAKSLGFIRTAVMRLSNIIDALLRLSRAGRIEYRFESVDLNKLAARVIAALEGTIQQLGATVAVAAMPPVRGDPAAVEQILANLIGNALNYLDPARRGSIQVGLLEAPPPQTPDGYRVYYVKDNGLGIPEAQWQKIFQVFQRAHPGVGKGEGMGLAIVHRVVERHGGRIWLESAVGRGTTFFFSLPAA
jgi:signal transduction histidine kinase/CHASE3 domain sensor protein